MTKVLSLLETLTTQVAKLQSEVATVQAEVAKPVPETPFKVRENRDAGGNLVFGQGTLRRHDPSEDTDRLARAKREEAAIKHTSEILASAAGPSGEKGPKVKQPPPWDGKAPGLDDFLYQTELYLMSYGVPLDTDSRAVFYAAANMKGMGLTYWRTYCNRAELGEVEPITRWGDFKTLFRNYFCHGNKAEVGRNKLRKLAQKSTVTAYNEYVMGIMLDLPNRDMGDLVNDYIQGLSDKIKLQVVLQQPKTIDWAMSTALQVESGVREAGFYVPPVGGGRPAWSNKQGSGFKTPDVRVSVAGTSEGKTCFKCGKPGHFKWQCPYLSAAEKAESDRLWALKKGRQGKGQGRH